MIKYRIWDKYSLKMFEVYQLAVGENNMQPHVVRDKESSDGFSEIYQSDGVEQYTGLKDVNGKEIYEGDIVKTDYKYAQPKVSRIIMECGNTYIAGEDLATGNEMLLSDHKVEVIGNIHENPELLEKE